MTEALVLGAGMVGVSTALALQKRGVDVALIDKSAPGQETSFGNAGIIQAEAAEPYPLPRDLPTLMRMALGRSNDVAYRLRDAVTLSPALWSYFRNSAPIRLRAIGAIYAQLTGRSVDDHDRWIAEAGAEDLIGRDGYWTLLRTAQGFDKAAREAERFASTYDVRSHVLSGAECQAAEPALTAQPAGAIHWLDPWTCRDPGALTAAYAALFAQRGGTILQGDATTLAQRGSGWQVDAADGAVDAAQAVIALGPWSPPLLQRFGLHVPMVPKRGYHWHMAPPVMPSRSIHDVENGIVAAPMAAGLRICSGVALSPLDAPVDLRQLDRGAKTLGQIMQLGPRQTEPQWQGTRPFLPDMLPIAGPVPQAPGLWAHFGHGHHGFTLGPTTGALLADAMTGQPSALAKLLAPDRLA